MEELYQQRLKRYTTAMRNEQPDCVPIRPFVAEFTAKYAGYTAQEVTHDFDRAFAAARKCAADFDWDAVVGNMVYVWTGLTQAIGTKYYAAPGIELPPNTGFQYLEPGPGKEHMRADEYDRLIDDPTGFLYEVWLPRVVNDVLPFDDPGALRDPHRLYRNNLSFIKGGMAMLQYFIGFGGQAERLRRESGTVSAIAGIFKAPLDIIADKLRGYVGLCDDLLTQPDKVMAACEALMPHLYHVALTSSDPSGTVPIGYWMHRGCVPFISHDQFNEFYWPTVKPIIEELWRNGRQTLFYAEGNWNKHLEAFAELPAKSIVYHCDQGDIFEISRKLGKKFCISGGIPNFMLAYRAPHDVRAWVKKVIEGVAHEGAYIMDASAIVQDEAKIENMKAMTEAAREFGVYSSAASFGAAAEARRDQPDPSDQADRSEGAAKQSLLHKRTTRKAPGVCIPWEEKLKEIPKIMGDRDLVKQVWENLDAFGYVYVWQCLLSF